MNNQQKELSEKWVKKLHLEDWDIRFKFDCIADDFGDTTTEGECKMDTVNKMAFVNILSPECYGERARPYDFERILVHELLHIKFILIDNTGDTIHDTIVHQLVEEMARLLTERK